MINGRKYDFEYFKSLPKIKTLIESNSMSPTNIQHAIIPFEGALEWFASDYLVKETWTTNEAASLLVGVDPILIPQHLEVVYPESLKSRKIALNNIDKAISENELPFEHRESSHHVKPRIFYKWAILSGYIKPKSTLSIYGSALEKHKI